MAANITLRMNGNVNAQKLTNAEWARLLAYYQGVYTTKDAQGNNVIPTEAQTVLAIYNAFIAGLLQNLQRAEQDTAAKSAANAITIVVPTSDVPA